MVLAYKVNDNAINTTLNYYIVCRLPTSTRHLTETHFAQVLQLLRTLHAMVARMDIDVVHQGLRDGQQGIQQFLYLLIGQL